MSIPQIMEYFCLSRNIMSIMKKQNPAKYSFITALDPDLKTALEKYISISEQTIDTAQQNHYILEDNNLVKEFSEYLAKTGVYKHPGTYLRVNTEMLFSPRTKILINFNTLNKIQVINKAFNTFTKGKND